MQQSFMVVRGLWLQMQKSALGHFFGHAVMMFWVARLVGLGAVELPNFQ